MSKPALRRLRSNSVTNVIEEMESDPAHHLAGPFLPQTPLSGTPPRRVSPPARGKAQSAGLWSDLITMKWVVRPESSFKLLCIPIILYTNWHLLAPYIAKGLPNPFEPLLFISYPVPSSLPGDQRYQKSYLDLVFIAYYIVVWSFIRQAITVNMARPLGRHFGIKKVAKLDRFGEQLYAVIYFSFFGIWGARIMHQLPTWWYKTEYFWLELPHWDMKPELKRYYLMHAAYWCQQSIVMGFGLEKPRKDYYELIAHHAVTLWLIGWSYLTNMTLIGNAVFLSMDLPDVLLGASKCLNYLQWETTKTIVFAIFIPIWIYFRVWLNLRMLWSVWNEFYLAPVIGDRWYPERGEWLVPWMRYQMFAPILLLLIINLFWTFLILRIAYRAVFSSKLDDERSDDEDEGNDDHEE